MEKFNLPNDTWMLGEDIPNADLFFSNVWCKTFVTTAHKTSGRSYTQVLVRYEGYHLWFYFGKKDSNDVAELIAERIVNEPGYANEINKNIIRTADALRAYSETIPQSNLEIISNRELLEIYNTHLKLHREYYEWCWLPVAVDMFHNNLTRRIKDYLRSINISDSELNTNLITLTQPTEKSLIFIEQEELLNIGEIFEEDSESLSILLDKPTQEVFDALPLNIKNRIIAHWKKYYYTKHLWVSGEYTIEDYVQQIKEIFESGLKPKEILAKQYQELEISKKNKEQLLDILNITTQWRNVLTAFGDFMVTKIYRRYAQLLAVHHMSAILKEIAKRNYITEKQVRFALPHEIEAMLLDSKDYSAELLTRAKRCVWYSDKDSDIIWTGTEADTIFEDLKEETPININELHGETGCLGYAKGKVKIIIRAEDMYKMEQGDILVSIATDPDIVPAMKKAAGIITEQGGVTSHAAIVARELGIPCVIGTKIATRVLKDGDIVEIDANQGSVKILH